MLKKLDLFIERYKELENLLADNAVLTNQKQYQQYAKELSKLSPIVKKYEEYKRVRKEIEGIKNILSAKNNEAEIIAMAKEELIELEKKCEACREDIEQSLLEEDSEGDKDVIVEIRAGTGGLEASLFAADLYRMYAKFAAEKGFRLETMNTNITEAGGFKEIIFSISGNNVYKNFRYESGIHRVQRVPDTEQSGRIHTSAVTVAVLPEPEKIDVQINPAELKIDVYRASGPGGQGVNTTDSAVRITHLPTGVVVTCQDERSQLKNKAKAMRILSAKIADKIKSDQQQKISNDRKLQVGSGDRSQKIRTYNFPERRVTDHRIGLTLYKLDAILAGDLDELIFALIEADKKEQLENKKE